MPLSGFDRIGLLVDLAHCRRFHEKRDAGDVVAWIGEEFASLALAAALRPNSVARDTLAAIAEHRRLAEQIVGPLPEGCLSTQALLSLPVARLLPWLRDEVAGISAEAEREPGAKERARLLAQAGGVRSVVESVVGKLPGLPEPGRVDRLRRVVSIHWARASARVRRLWDRAHGRLETFGKQVSAFFIRGGMV